jgi:hypothetical protein
VSQLSVTTDFILNRTSWTAELRAAENDVKSLAQRLAQQPLKVPAVLDIDATRLRAAIAAAQAVANANPITIPVVYGAPGGMPGGGGYGGGGGLAPRGSSRAAAGGGGGGYPTGPGLLVGGGGAGLGGSPAPRGGEVRAGGGSRRRVWRRIPALPWHHGGAGWIRHAVAGGCA